MATLTDMLAAVVLHSSAAVYAHFGVAPEAVRAQPPPAPAPAQHVVARTPRKEGRAEHPERPATAAPELRSRPILAA